MKHDIQFENCEETKWALVKNLYSEHFGKLSRYADLLLWWNDKINLVSRGVSRETILKHVEHSLFISTSEYFDGHAKITDTGTGGGLPGIPLAICFPEKEFVLNDIVKKKIMALKGIVTSLGLKNIITQEGSIADFEVNRESLIITKHAFKINELIDLLSEKDWKKIIFLKGAQETISEINESKVEIVANVTRLDANINDPFYSEKALVEIVRKE